MDLAKTNYKALTPGEYLTAAEFEGLTPTLTISEIEMHTLESTEKSNANGKKEAKTRHRGVVFFKETKTPRGWVLNSTNAQCLAKMFGEIVGGWIGKRVTLCAEKVQLGSTQELGIRVKGSPDLVAPITVEIRLPKKRPVTRTLVTTARGAQSGPG